MHDDPSSSVLSAAARRVLREDQPSRYQLDAAYLRFSGRQQRRSRHVLVARWLVAGLAMGLGAAFAAEAAAPKVLPPLHTPEPPHSSLSEPRRRAAAATASPAAASPSASAIPQIAVPTSAPATRAVPADDPVQGAANGAAWARAAHGLRNHDVTETEAALALLEDGGSNSDREAARLIRAQLMLHQGDARGARAVLIDLASHAQSPVLRSKARSLLEQAAPKTNSPLSAGPSGT